MSAQTLYAALEYLQAIEPLQALTGGHIYGDLIPDKTPLPQACLVLTDGGGPRDITYQSYATHRIVAWAYGKDIEEARFLDKYARRFLYKISGREVNGVLVFSALSETNGQDQLDSTGWPLVMSTYAIVTDDVFQEA